MKVSEVSARLDSAGHEALWLMSCALGMSSAEILSRSEFSIDEEQKVNALISRRISGEPLQYILGEADFYGRDFRVGPGVLIPRHDTETLIEGVKKCFSVDDSFRFLDWGTGSGCLAVTILLEFPNSSANIFDISDEALSYARENLSRYGLEERAKFGVDSEFDLIVSNPPYIPSRELSGLMREVRDYEPGIALDGGADGMDFYREITELGTLRVRRGGYIIFETGNMNQVRELERLSGDFEFVNTIFDDGNFPRCLILRRQS
ncbi:MAG: peptide chain release factor N(5)-glutamine methyltransferase [Synergistaceae bacterium]|nr:peptide chain release factor N(5)-glutamine methyltransferase [Synergistaceae bacterium]